MLLTADHLAALEELEATAPATLPQLAPHEHASAIYRALERSGLAQLAQVAHTQRYVLTTAGRQAQRLIAGMLATGYLYQRELMTPGWRFIDDTILAAMETALHDDDRVDVAAAPLLLGRGLAELRDDPVELRMYIVLTAFGRTWLDLIGQLHEQPGGPYESVVAMDPAAGSIGPEVLSHPALA